MAHLARPGGANRDGLRVSLRASLHTKRYGGARGRPRVERPHLHPAALSGFLPLAAIQGSAGVAWWSVLLSSPAGRTVVGWRNHRVSRIPPGMRVIQVSAIAATS